MPKHRIFVFCFWCVSPNPMLLLLLFCQHLTTIKLYASLLYQYGDLNCTCRAFCTLCKHRLSILRRIVCTLIQSHSLRVCFVFVSVYATLYFVCKVRSANRQITKKSLWFLFLHTSSHSMNFNHRETFSQNKFTELL